MADLKKFTRKEISEGTSKTNPVFIIDNVVYDVSKFLDEHPGGHEVLVHQAGNDASEEFADVGHSFDAKELMKKFVVGELVDEDKSKVTTRQVTWDDREATEVGYKNVWQLPLVLGAIATLFAVLYSSLLA